MSELLFIQDCNWQYLGLMYLSAMLRLHSHQTKLVIGKDIDGIKEAIEAFQPDAIGFPVMTGGQKWAAQLAKQIKEKYGIISIMGGPHPTYFPDYINNEGVEVIIRGESEFPLLDVMERIEVREDFSDVQNVSLKRDGKIIENPMRNIPQDLDVYPFPDRSLYDFLEKRIDRTVKEVLTSRGCPYQCSFCFATVQRRIYPSNGKHVRFRSIDNVLQEIKELKESSKVNQIYFADSVFGLDKKWLYEFLSRYRVEIGIPFFGLVRANIVTDEFAKNLKDAGCVKVFFGIESGNEEIRNHILRKNVTNKQIYRAAQLLHKYKIKFRSYNILGLPGETMETAMETVKINVDIKPGFPWCSLFTPLPGTVLTQYALDRGFLDDNFDFDKVPKSYYSISLLNLSDKTKIENLQKFFQTAVLWPWTFPLIKKMIALRPNFIFNWWFSLIYFYIFLKAESTSFWKTLMFAIDNYRNIILKNK